MTATPRPRILRVLQVNGGNVTESAPGCQDKSPTAAYRNGRRTVATAPRRRGPGASVTVPPWASAI